MKRSWQLDEIIVKIRVKNVPNKKKYSPCIFGDMASDSQNANYFHVKKAENEKN